MPKKSEKIEEKAEKIKVKKLSQGEYEGKIVELAKKGLTSEKIGEELRRQGIHPKEHKKKISKILQENKLYSNPDLKNTEDKLKKIREHLAKNKGDKRSMREKDRIFSRLRRVNLYLNR